MAMRSMIGIINTDNTVDAIYCHSNGYLEYMTDILSHHYETEEKAKELVSLGGLSRLEKKLTPSTGNHSFDHPEPDVTVAYARDRGEKWEHCKPTHYKTADELFQEENWCLYFYLYDVKMQCWTYMRRYRMTDCKERKTFRDTVTEE